MEPASDFVEDFVGADRALKRLALLRISDIDLWEAPVSRAGEPTAPVTEALRSAEVPHAVLVDDEQRPLGLLSVKDLDQERVPGVADTDPTPILEARWTLRDGLANLLASGSQYGVVVDGRGHLSGVLSAEIISDFLASPEAVETDIPAVDRPHE